MAIDFEIPPEDKAIREKVRQWVHDECIPAEKELEGKPLKQVLDPLRKKARAQGLWMPFVPKEYGGMGLGPLANALVQMELGESALGALSMNSQGPDDATILQTRAVKDGNENYVRNGEKGFSSAASAADIALVMAMTDPDAPRHQRYSTFIVELPNPGYIIKRDIKTMAAEGPL